MLEVVGLADDELATLEIHFTHFVLEVVGLGDDKLGVWVLHLTHLMLDEDLETTELVLGQTTHEGEGLLP